MRTFLHLKLHNFVKYCVHMNSKYAHKVSLHKKLSSSGNAKQPLVEIALYKSAIGKINLMVTVLSLFATYSIFPII